MNKSVSIICWVILILGCFVPSRAGAQEIDPFYLQRLISGERAFLDGNYKTAIEELEIALFGVQGEKQLKAKAYLFLGMSHYHLGNKDRATTYLRDARDNLGMEGLRDFVPDDSVWFYLNRILADLKLTVLEREQQAGAGAPAQRPVQKQAPDSNAAAFARNLERQIKADPQNAGLYYDLYEHYTANNNAGAAEKTLENLIKKIPEETKGYYLLGKIQYRQRDLKNAEKNLEKVFTLQEKVPVEEFMLLEAKVYHILTVLLRGDRTRAYKMFAEWSGNLTEERVRFLDLEEQDRGILRGIAEGQEEQAAIEMPAGEDEGDSGENAPAEMEVDSSGDLSPDNIVPLDQVDTPPVLRERVSPKYPAAAVEREIEGIVIVNALISETGDVLDVVVVQGLAGGFNEETVKAVMQWKYEPAVKDGQKVKVRKPISITFKAKLNFRSMPVGERH